MLADDDLDIANGKGLATNKMHYIRVGEGVGFGIEATMPRPSKYERALRLDMQAKYMEAYQLFREAQNEFSKIRVQNKKRRKLRELWMAKAAEQRSLSYELYRSRLSSKSAPRYPYRRHSSRWYRGYYQYYNFALAAHKKWLAIRSLGLGSNPALANQAIKNYKKVLSLRSNYSNARIALAGLYYELGRAGHAKKVMAKLSYMNRYMSWMFYAYYLTVSGNIDSALKELKKGIGKNFWRKRQVKLSNFFDRLRADPRFQKLVQ